MEAELLSQTTSQDELASTSDGDAEVWKILWKLDVVPKVRVF
jgi:hypothetical protein